MGIENIKKSEKQNKRRTLLAIAKITLLLLIVVGIPLYLYLFHRDWIAGMRDIEGIVAWLRQYEELSIAVYVLVQILQIVISVIPGQVVQIAAGYLFGFWLALLLAMGGCIIGTAISFTLAKVLGRDFLHLFFGEEKIAYYLERLNSKRAYTIVFFLYLIPGIPKDMISYAAGVSEMNCKPFLILSYLGRLPGMIGCLLMGTMAENENYIGAGILAVAAVICCILCILFRRKINGWLDKLYDRLKK